MSGDPFFDDLQLDGADRRLRQIDARAAELPSCRRGASTAASDRAPADAPACRCARPIDDGDGMCLWCGRVPADAGAA